MILGLRLGRRMLAAVGFRSERFSLADSRYIGRRERLSEIAAGYFRQLLAQSQPTAVYVYAPTTPDSPQSLTEELVRVLEREAAEVGVTVKSLSRADVFGSFGLVSVRTRRELLETMLTLWPEMTEVKAQRQLAVAEAAAVALVGDLQESWPPV